MTKENIKKIKLIKKYAKIRFKRWWKEWGFSKEELGMILGCIALFFLIAELYFLGCMLV